MMDATTDASLYAVAPRDVRRRVAIILSLLLILAAAVAALFLVRGVDEQLEDVGNTYEVRRQARDLILALTDAETGQRGYLITQDDRYLEPYQRSVRSLDEIYENLIKALANQPDRQAVIVGLGDEIDQKRAELASTVSLVSNGRIQEALVVVRSDAGQSLMEKLRTTIRTFIAQEDASLVDRNANVERYRQWLVAAILAALAGAATLAYALFTRTQAQVSRLDQSRQALLVQNEELEALIRARTAEVDEAREHAERERERVETLLQDTNHRIGNSLATVSSLLGLQLSRSESEEVKNALAAAQNRVHAIASGHRRLRLGKDLETTQADEFLSAVVEDLRSTHASAGKVELVTDFEALQLNARDATTIGIIVGELVTNALKHAFPGDRQGRIWVRLGRDGEGVIELTVSDDGQGLPEKRGEGDTGLGSMIVRQLAQQFGGKPRYATREGGGTEVNVTLPSLEQSED